MSSDGLTFSKKGFCEGLYEKISGWLHLPGKELNLMKAFFFI